MRLFSKKPKGDLVLNYDQIAGYALTWLPCSQKALQVAFPHLTVKAEPVPGYNGPETEDGFALYADDPSAPALCVAPDQDSGYAFSITAHNAQALCLGEYQIGRTTLGEFHDEHLDEAGFWVDGSKIMLMGGEGNNEKTNRTRFLFEPPADFSGDLTKAGDDVWRRCVLSEMRYLISARRTRPTETIDDAGAVKLLKKEKLHDPVPLPPGSNVDLFQMLRRELYDPTKARNNYVKLADVAIYNADPATVKTNIKAIFKQHDTPESVTSEIAYMFNDDWHTTFMFTLDWKADIQDLPAQITTALGDQSDQITFPDLADFPENGSVGVPGVFEAYAKALQAAGFDLWSVDNGSDTHFLFVAPLKARKRVAKLFEPTHMMADPFSA